MYSRSTNVLRNVHCSIADLPECMYIGWKHGGSKPHATLISLSQIPPSCTGNDIVAHARRGFNAQVGKVASSSIPTHLWCKHFNSNRHNVLISTCSNNRFCIESQVYVFIHFGEHLVANWLIGTRFLSS